MPDRDVISFRFTGGIADLGEMNFYEAGRYRYAAARLLYTLEEFRQTGTVKRKIRTFVNVDLRTKPTEQGSFVDAVIVSLAPIIADGQLRVPLDKILSWAFDKILLKSNHNDRILKLAQTLAEGQAEFSRASIERDRTQQAEIDSRNRILDALLKRLLSEPENPALLRDASHLFQSFGASPVPVNDEIGSVAFAWNEIEAELERNSSLDSVREELARIPPEKEEMILQRVREIVPEVAQPLRRSATSIEISASKSRKKIAVLNETRVSQIGKSNTGPEALFRGNIVRYDKAQGYGKIHLEEQREAVTFRVRADMKAANRDEILEAMKQPRVEGIFIPTMDGTGRITRLLFKRLLDPKAA